MPEMRLERIFWPVGHGAFYTEHFRNRVNKHLFTAVYDCGGKNEDVMRLNIDKMKRIAGENIDVLFISHLHRDHINGLDYLKSNISIKHIILPYLTKSAIAEAYIYNALTGTKKGHLDTESSMQQFVFDLGSNDHTDDTITFVRPEEDGMDHNDSVEIFDIEHIRKNIKNGQPIKVIGDINSHEPYWVYIPVNVKFDEGKCKKLLDKICKTAYFVHIKNGENINWQELRNALKSAGKKEIEAVKNVYKEIFNGNHNAYSMPVYSGPSYKYYPHYWDVKLYRDSYTQQWMRSQSPKSIYFREWKSNKEFDLEVMLPCLYMGDFEASNEEKLEELQCTLGGYYDYVGMQQIPHHFSLNNHATDLYKNRVCAFGSVDNHGDVSFTHSVCRNIEQYAPVLIITEDASTIFRSHFNLW